MKFHPLSELFPLIEGIEFDELVTDIQTNGLREPVWVYKNQILDGRNRFLACKKAGIKPKTQAYTGDDPLSFVISRNVHRRHLSDAQRAMLAAKIATMRQGQRTDLASRGAKSQTEAASELGVSRRSVQRAKKVIDHGSKALQQATESGAVPLQKAASVVGLPKSEQLAAATKKPERPAIDDDRWEPDADEDALHEALEKEVMASVDKVMNADDKMAAAHAEIKRQAAEIAALKLSRDGFMNGKAALNKLLKTEQRKVEKLRKQLEAAQSEIEKFRERLAIVEEAA